MLRYLLLSTAIVLGVAIVAAGWIHRDLIRIKIASVYAHAHAPPHLGSAPGQGSTASLRGDAPWALSALPDCLIQMSKSTGSLRYVRAHLPRAAVPVSAPATLIYGDCSIKLVSDEAYVRRGTDRLRIPPRAEFYRAGDLLALIRETPQGAELRVYEPAHR